MCLFISLSHQNINSLIREAFSILFTTLMLAPREISGTWYMLKKGMLNKCEKEAEILFTEEKMKVK